ncbi:F0F1 ATP synthase subunit B [Propionibacteriaceae bacterium G57]|uniref:F0F1 ATP synthase subunit B n=1 Tax=Aestuariimicrobium sp. G57 TaxID=3418485 RepID=UPI003DA6E58B
MVVVAQTWAPLAVDLGPLLPSHLSEFIVGIILAVLIWIVIAKVGVPAFEKMYAERAEAIQGGMQRAEKAQVEAEKALAEYRQQLSEAREEAARIREDAKNQGAQIVADMRAQATKDADRILVQAQSQMEAERNTVIKQLRGEVGGLATTLAGKIVGESLEDDQRTRNTVDRFIAEIEAEAAKAEHSSNVGS